MDLRFLVASLTMDEVKDLDILIHNRVKEDSSHRMKTMGYLLSGSEITLINHGKYIDAIKSAKDRLALTLMDAKTLVDDFRDKVRKEKK